MGHNKLRGFVKDIYEHRHHIHDPIISPGRIKDQGSGNPSTVAYGTVEALVFTLDTDYAYRTLKICPDAESGSTSFHAHWTKSQNTNQQNKNVKWKLEITQFNGETNVIDGAAVVHTTYLTGSYAAADTTSRVCYETGEVVVPQLIPNYYLGVKLSAETTDNSLDEPALVCVDFEYDDYINQ